MSQPITVGQTVTIQPGDTLTFVPPDASVQYHFAVAASGAPTIGIWRGEPVKGNGVARNQPGKSYVDHVCGAGTFTITIWGITGPATVSVSANSWWRKVFGWG